MSKFFDWFFNRKRVVFMGLSGSGKTTFLEVLKKKKNVNPKEIDLKTSFRDTLSMSFNGHNIHSIDEAGSDDIYKGHKYTEDLNNAKYYIYIFDCYRYLEAKEHNKVPVEEEYQKQTDEELTKYLKQTTYLLKKLSQQADKKRKKMIIVASHADMWLRANYDKTITDLKNRLENNIIKNYSAVSWEVADVTKYEEVKRIIDILFTK